MRKQGFTIIEIVIVFLLILGVVFLVFPSSLNNTKHAKLISKWYKKYSSLEYMYSVIKAQQENGLREKINGAKNNKAKKHILLETIKPYLRINSELNKKYKQHYMNGQVIDENSQYYFDNFYVTAANEIIGLKWVDADCEKEKTCAMMSIDLNGLTPPNSWGYDIFGVNIKQNAIEPLGKGLSEDVLKYGCNKKREGVYCSYYYLIGGRFD